MRWLFERIYRKAREPGDLPWHHDASPEILTRVVARRNPGGRALDIGCGTGVYAAYLAQQGYAVTALDFVDRALEMARDRAAREGVSFETVRADVLQWPETGTFDLILDSGCLHGMTGLARRVYRERILRWLAPGGDFVLAHFGRRHALDWRPIGPRRIPRAEVEAFFAPELAPVDRGNVVRTRVPLPVGPTILLEYYAFNWSSDAE